MTQGSELQSYRGVKCLHCEQPIPISPIIAGIEADVRDNEKASKLQKCQVFHLRCMACGKEKPYKISEILKFEGTPATPASGAKPVSSNSRLGSDRSKAANA